MKSFVLVIAPTLLLASLAAQERKPWQVDKLCGKLEYANKTPNRKDANTFSEKRKALREILLELYERRVNQVCCENMNAVETTTTGRGGHFEFRTKKAGNFWLATKWGGKDYRLPVVYKPEKNSAAVCSQQGIALDGDGNGERWEIVTVHLTRHVRQRAQAQGNVR